MERKNIERNFCFVMKQYWLHTNRRTAGCRILKLVAFGLRSTTSKKKIDVSAGLNTLFTLLVLIAIILTTIRALNNAPKIQTSHSPG